VRVSSVCRPGVESSVTVVGVSDSSTVNSKMSLRRLLRGRRTLAIVAVGSTLTLSTYYALGSSRPSFPPPPPGGRPPPPWNPPSRKEMLDALRANVPVTLLKDKKDLVLNGDEEYDLLVVGGGAVGAGVVLDAATRGLKVALVEREDFSSG
jgi:glycerol-3-phosphate dehydrogenase